MRVCDISNLTKLKMSREELNAESARLAQLIRKGSEAGIKALQERTRGFTEEEMRAAVKRHHREAAEMWKQRPTTEEIANSEQRRQSIIDNG